VTKGFAGERGKVKIIICERSTGGSFEIEADLVILALGFLHPEHKGLVSRLKLDLDERGNVKAGADYMSSRNKVFVAGDMRRGQSLAVWAIAEGRSAAHCIDKYLMGESNLPIM